MGRERRVQKGDGGTSNRRTPRGQQVPGYSLRAEKGGQTDTGHGGRISHTEWGEE